MKSRYGVLVVGSLLALSLLVGCGGSDKKGKDSGASDDFSVRSIKAGAVKSGSLISGLDDGRVDASPPEGWGVAPRNSKGGWLIQYKTKQGVYPSIFVFAEEYSGDVFDVSQDNVKDFAKRRAAEIKKSRPIGPVQLVEIGDFAGITYRLQGTAKYDHVDTKMDRVLLETVVGKRLYTLELRLPYTMGWKKYEPQLHAAAKGLKIKRAEVEPPQETPEETPSADAEAASDEPADGEGAKEPAAE